MYTQAVTMLLAASLVSGRGGRGGSGAQDWQVVVHSSYRTAIKFEIAPGVVRPCNSSSNGKLVAQELPASGTFVFVSPEAEVCFRHTFEDFPDRNWSTDRIYSPPQSCYEGVCRYANSTITIDVR